jgi:hypothetical protein
MTKKEGFHSQSSPQVKKYRKRYRDLLERDLTDSERDFFIPALRGQLEVITQWSQDLADMARDVSLHHEMTAYIGNNIVVRARQRRPNLTAALQLPANHHAVQLAQTAAFFGRIAVQLDEYKAGAAALMQGTIETVHNLRGWLVRCGAYASTIYRNAEGLFLLDMKGVFFEMPTPSGTVGVPIPEAARIACMPFSTTLNEMTRIATALQENADHWFANEEKRGEQLVQFAIAEKQQAAQGMTLWINLSALVVGLVWGVLMPDIWTPLRDLISSPAPVCPASPAVPAICPGPWRWPL